MKKHRSVDKPVAFHGKVVFEFFNNDDEAFKIRTLHSLARDVRKELNISCIVVEEHMVENPERGALVVSLCAGNHDQGRAVLDKALAFFDGKAPARIISDDFEAADIL
jgi:hypothetical protein